ncbi:MAG TPA: hypothetical protein VFI94_16575 [Pseudolabrys sp.]|nr:hypothetical protein [Pseudolabrys sp.]
MKRVVAVAGAMLATAALATEKKTYSYICRGGGFTITANVDHSGTIERWSKSEPVILQIAGEPAQTLTADPDAPDADSYRNKDYEFYALKKFITLTHKSHGVTVKFYSECRELSRRVHRV